LGKRSKSLILRKLSNGDKPPLVITLMYIEAYGISIDSPDIFEDEINFGKITPINIITKGIRNETLVIVNPFFGKNDRTCQIPLKKRNARVMGIISERIEIELIMLKYTSVCIFMLAVSRSLSTSRK
jgi:hypothetical protein